MANQAEGARAPHIVTIYVGHYSNARTGRTAVVAVLNAGGAWKALGYQPRALLPEGVAAIESFVCGLEALTRPRLVHLVTGDEEFALALADETRRPADPLSAAHWAGLEESLGEHTLFCCEVSPDHLLVQGLRQAAHHATTRPDVESQLGEIEEYAPKLAGLEESLHAGDLVTTAAAAD